MAPSCTQTRNTRGLFTVSISLILHTSQQPWLYVWSKYLSSIFSLFCHHYHNHCIISSQHHLPSGQLQLPPNYSQLFPVSSPILSIHLLQSQGSNTYKSHLIIHLLDSLPRPLPYWFLHSYRGKPMFLGIARQAFHGLSKPLFSLALSSSHEVSSSETSLSPCTFQGFSCLHPCPGWVRSFNGYYLGNIQNLYNNPSQLLI